MLLNISLGICLIIATTAIHSAGMLLCVRLAKNAHRHGLKKAHTLRISVIVMLMFCTALAEVTRRQHPAVIVIDADHSHVGIARQLCGGIGRKVHAVADYLCAQTPFAGDVMGQLWSLVMIDIPRVEVLASQVR